MEAANDNRPDGFDDALIAYLPSLRKQANHIAGNKVDGEELLQEAVDTMLRRAAGCRVQTFRVWAQLTLCGTASSMRQKARRHMRRAPTVSLTPANANDASFFDRLFSQMQTPSTQDVEVDLSDVIETLRTIKDGDLLLRRAMGWDLQEIGDETGITREAVRQREVRARGVLIKRMRRGKACA